MLNGFVLSLQHLFVAFLLQFFVCLFYAITKLKVNREHQPISNLAYLIYLQGKLNKPCFCGQEMFFVTIFAICHRGCFLTEAFHPLFCSPSVRGLCAGKEAPRILPGASTSPLSILQGCVIVLFFFQKLLFLSMARGRGKSSGAHEMGLETSFVICGSPSKCVPFLPLTGGVQFHLVSLTISGMN